MSLSFDNSETGCMLLFDCHRSIPAPFLTKTYHLVNDPSTNEIVSWGETNTTFVVWRPPEFARDLLPKYFKHNNFSSFVRQLNTYGFRKIVPERWEFASDFFRRGERHLLCEIHRRKALQPVSVTGSVQQSRSLSPSTSIEDQAWSSITSAMPSPLQIIVPTHQNVTTIGVSDEMEKLRKDNNMLLSEVSRLSRLYEEAMAIIQHQNFKGSSPDLITYSRIGASGQSIDRTASAPLPGEPAIHQQFVGPVVRMEGFRELSSVHTRTTNFDPYRSPLLPTSAIQEKPSNESIISGDSKPTSLCVKPTEAASSSNTSNETTPEGTRVTVKLFGVPLHGQAGDPGSFNHEASEVGMKRHQPESWDTVYNPGSPRKYLRLETTPESRPSTPQQQVPWLQISATRDEGVYI